MLSGDVVWPPTCPVTTVVVVVVVAGGGGGGGGARCPRSEVTAQGEMAAGPCGWAGGRAAGAWSVRRTVNSCGRRCPRRLPLPPRTSHITKCCFRYDLAGCIKLAASD